MVAAAGDVEHGEEVGRLAGGGEHSRRTALQRGDLCRHVVAGGILEPGIEIPTGLQIKQLAHILAGVVFEGGALNDGDLPGLSVPWGIAALDACGFDLVFWHLKNSFVL